MNHIAKRIPKRIAVTGASGNLGRKIIPGLLGIDSVETLVALDPRVPERADGDPRVVWHQADLTRPMLGWAHLLSGADTIIHLAATNPAPDSGWQDAFAGFDMTARLALYSLEGGVERLIFASSNHAMGGHFKPQGPLPEPDSLKGDLLPRPGTRWTSGGREIDSIIYGSSKGYGERLMAMAGEASGDRLSTVSIRIGWVQPGRNDKSTISADGQSLPSGTSSDTAETPATQWFKGMWLSNRDLQQLMRCAVEAGTDTWPGSAIVVNGVSNNPGMGWSLDEGERYLGYRPRD